MHPWEDWAETFAHYLHIRDTLQTAGAYGVRVGAAAPAPDAQRTSGAAGRLAAADLRAERAQPQHGRDDLYPFVLPAPVVDKLAFVHERVTAARPPG